MYRSKDKHELFQVEQELLNTGNVIFIYDTKTIIKNKGYLIPIDYYYEEFIDNISLEKIMEEIQSNIPFFKDEHKFDIDFDKSLCVSICADESFYQVTVDFWFEQFTDAEKIAENMDIASENIYDLENGCYIYDEEDN